MIELAQVRVLNFTPHTINVVGTVSYEILSDGLARCETKRVMVDSLVFGETTVPINRTAFGVVTGLPEPEEGTFIVVSALVAQALKGQRTDLIIPDDAVRDEVGRIIGCRAFARV